MSKSTKPAANLSANVGNAGKGRKPAAVAVPPAPAPSAAETAWRETLRGISGAHEGAARSIVTGFECAARHGVPAVEWVAQEWPGCSQPAQYVSNFARGHKAAQVIGSAGALEVIAGAVAIEGGRAAEHVMGALSAVIEAGKERAKNGHTGEATGNARGLIVAGAIRKAEKAQDARKATKATAKGAQPGKVTTTKAPPTLGELVAGFIANAAQLSKATKPEGCSKAKWGRVMAAVNAAGEALAEFQTKPAK